MTHTLYIDGLYGESSRERRLVFDDKAPEKAEPKPKVAEKVEKPEDLNKKAGEKGEEERGKTAEELKRREEALKNAEEKAKAGASDVPRPEMTDELRQKIEERKKEIPEIPANAGLTEGQRETMQKNIELLYANENDLAKAEDALAAEQQARTANKFQQNPLARFLMMIPIPFFQQLGRNILTQSIDKDLVKDKRIAVGKVNARFLTNSAVKANVGFLTAGSAEGGLTFGYDFGRGDEEFKPEEEDFIKKEIIPTLQNETAMFFQSYGIQPGQDYDAFMRSLNPAQLADLRVELYKMKSRVMYGENGNGGINGRLKDAKFDLRFYESGRRRSGELPMTLFEISRNLFKDASQYKGVVAPPKETPVDKKALPAAPVLQNRLKEKDDSYLTSIAAALKKDPQRDMKALNEDLKDYLSRLSGSSDGDTKRTIDDQYAQALTKFLHEETKVGDVVKGVKFVVSQDRKRIELVSAQSSAVTAKPVGGSTLVNQASTSLSKEGAK
jgi:hypothetical protein